MLLSHKQQWIFIHIPKTGGSSISSALEPYCDVIGASHAQMNDLTIPLSDKQSRDYHQHDSITEVNDKLLLSGYTPRDYNSFCVYRNPWDHAVSEWSFYHKMVNNNSNPIPWYKKILSECKDFSTYVRSSYWEYNYFSIKSFWDIKYMIKFETMQNDFDMVCSRIGLPKIKLPHYNKTMHKHYSEYYDQETRDIVANKSWRIIERFDYKF